MLKRFLPFILLTFLLLTSCASMEVFSSIKYAFATRFETTIYNEEEKHLKSIDEIISTYDILFDAYSEYENVNNIYTINHTNESVKVSEKLYDALFLANQYYISTEGYFNPLMGELTFAYKESYKENKLPSEKVINNGLLHLKSSYLRFNEENLTVQRIGNSLLDLGAFAKGYVLDIINDYCLANGVKSYMVDGGTSSLLVSEKPNGDPFKIGIRYLHKRYINLKDSTLGLSGIFEQNITIDGKVYSHIINPFTGRPDVNSDFALVLNKCGSLSDVLSTVFMLLDEDQYNIFQKKFNIEYMTYKDSQLISKSNGLEVFAY